MAGCVLAGMMVSGCASVHLPWADPAPPAANAPLPSPQVALPVPKKPRPLAIRPADGDAERSALAKFIANEYGAAPSLASRIVEAAYESGAKHDLPPALLLAITARESTFRPQVTNSYGAVGLMQVVPRFHPGEVARRGGADALLHPETNIDIGARIIARYRREEGNLREALAKYSGQARGYFGKVAAKWRTFDRVRDRARARPHASAELPLGRGPFEGFGDRIGPDESGFLQIGLPYAEAPPSIRVTIDDARAMPERMRDPGPKTLGSIPGAGHMV